MKNIQLHKYANHCEPTIVPVATWKVGYFPVVHNNNCRSVNLNIPSMLIGYAPSSMSTELFLVFRCFLSSNLRSLSNSFIRRTKLWIKQKETTDNPE
jgi:hypothetical protein